MMNARLFPTSVNLSPTAAELLLLALSAASLGCAIAAYDGGAEAAPAIAVTPAFAVPAAQAPAGRPVAGADEPARCAPGARRAHGLCRSVDLPSV
jgi:hypothetical protein